MTSVHVVPGSIDHWRTLPTDPQGMPAPTRAIVAYGPDGRAWTDEDVRRFWRRTARTAMRAAFIEHGHDWDVFDALVVRMERAMSGYHGEDQPRGAPVPFLTLAWEGATEGFQQAWDRPRELLDPREDEAPTVFAQEAAVARAKHARSLYSDSLARPKGSAA
jgi:hypothetical protein